MNRKKALIIIFTVLVLAVVGLAGTSWCLLDFSLKPAYNKGRSDAAMYRRVYTAYPAIQPWIDSLRQCGGLHDTMLAAPQGYALHALYIRRSNTTPRVAVVVHGYTDCAVYMLPWAKLYYDLGYNVFLPELFGNGHSAGDHQQMGWNDRLDVLKWMEVAQNLFAVKGKPSVMVVHGVSMGAATTMCVSGESTPDYVKAFVEDCGYTSVWDEFAYELKEQFGLPELPLLPAASLLCRLRYGWSFGEASPLRMVAMCRKPMLFIHGGADNFVPTRMVFPLYHAKPQPKMLWIAPGSRHAKSLHDYPGGYESVVRRFLNRYLPTE